MQNLATDPRFHAIQSPRNIWAFSAIHGENDRLTRLHDAVLERIRPGDRIIYLGNYTGYGRRSRETVDELLTFRRMVLAMPSVVPEDIVYLRGAQEEMWQKLTQLQFSQNPIDTLLWMLGSGMGSTMESYGINPHEGVTAAREGIMALTRWTNTIRDAVRWQPGHDVFMSQYRRAAYTILPDGRTPVLFVNAGLNPSYHLTEQNDNFWWDCDGFARMTDAYAPFEKVVRGFDPAHQGVRVNCVTASLDGGCGFGGPLVCAGMKADGEIFEILET